MQEMKKRLTGVFACALLCAWTAAAQQIDVKITLAYNVFVIGEPVLVQLEALNATRDLIQIGPGSSDALFVEVSRRGQYDDVLKPFNAQPLVGAFRLTPGQTMKYKVELDKWFSLFQEGKYIARLVLVHQGVRYESTRKSFDVVPGLPVLEGVQMFVNVPKLKRHFRLVYWYRNQVNRLFLRISDEPEFRIWDTIDLGSLMRDTPPKLDIAPDGEVTVVHRSTQDAFIRTVVWSLPNSVEVAERNALLDPEISASQRVKSLYGEMSGKEKPAEEKHWWKFW